MSRLWMMLACLALMLPACSKPADDKKPAAGATTDKPQATEVAKADQPSKPKKPKFPSYLTPAEAGPDFEIQGEYVGTSGTNQMAAQVIALGDGKFRYVLYEGGLPGDGWTSEDVREEFDAQRNDQGVVEVDLEDPAGTTTIRGGKIVGKSKDPSIADEETYKKERKSQTLGAKPPQGAIVLFDGTSADAFENGRMTEDGLLMEGVTSKQKFGDCTVHLEFRTPFMPTATGQARGNSGCYLQGRYEVQILDSFGLLPADNLCGGIYEIAVPKLNMCYPPLTWQTYDIDYTAAKFDESGKKTENARITVRHNGELIHDNVELTHATRSSPVSEGPDKGPLYLQDHGNPVRFRNIWIVEK